MYELQKLHSILLTGEKMSNEEIQNEETRLQQAFLNMIFSDHKPRNIGIYIEKHISALSHIFEQVNLATRERSDTLKAICLRLIRFLESHGAAYFNPDLPLPAVRQEQLTIEVENILPLAREVINAINDDDFRRLFFEDVSDLLSLRDITYGQMLMILGLIDSIAGLRTTLCDNKNLRDEITELLLIFNFNSLNIFELEARRIEMMCTEENLNDAPRLSRLQFKYKRFVHKKGHAFHFSRPSLGEMLSDFTQEKMLRQLTGVEDLPIESDAKAKQERQLTSLSVDKLGFLSRLLLDTYVLRSNNWKKVARFMGLHFVTVGNASDMPVDSIYNHMYTPSLKTIAGVIDILDKMMKRAVIWKNAIKNTGEPPEKVS